MSDETRNRRFERKSRQKSQNTAAGDAPRRRSSGMRAHGALGEPRKAGRKQASKGRGREGGAGWIWGLHAVKAALANPKRTIHDIQITENTMARLRLPQGTPPPSIVMPQQLDKQFGSGHQGIAIKAAPLEWPDIHQISSQAADDGLILVLDQITDPHNVGAMLRLASAFGVSALVMQTRNAPPLAGATAKVAVGCVETVPVCLVTNIGNTLKALQKENWMVTGLAGETELNLAKAVEGNGRNVIVMGAEGPGLRPRVRDCCDQLARIPMHSSDVLGQAESLNVATAAGIALYEVRRG